MQSAARGPHCPDANQYPAGLKNAQYHSALKPSHFDSEPSLTTDGQAPHFESAAPAQSLIIITIKLDPRRERI